jgi:hypothetical protein
MGAIKTHCKRGHERTPEKVFGFILCIIILLAGYVLFKGGL